MLIIIFKETVLSHFLPEILHSQFDVFLDVLVSCTSVCSQCSYALEVYDENKVENICKALAFRAEDTSKHGLMKELN